MLEVRKPRCYTHKPQAKPDVAVDRPPQLCVGKPADEIEHLAAKEMPMNNCEGEVWLANLGVEGKIRPVIIVDWDIDSNNVIYIPLTTVDRGRDQVSIPDLQFLREKSFANIFFISIIDGEDLMRKLGSLPESVYDEVTRKSNELIESGHTFSSFRKNPTNSPQNTYNQSDYSNRPFSKLAGLLDTSSLTVYRDKNGHYVLADIGSILPTDDSKPASTTISFGENTTSNAHATHSVTPKEEQKPAISPPQQASAAQSARIPLFARILLAAGAAALGIPLIA